MNPKTLRFFGMAGVLLTLFLSVWYLMKTYNDGNPRWIFLILALGIAILLSYNLIGSRREE